MIETILRIGAAAPPVFKSNAWLRVFRRLSRGSVGCVVSNLGIERRLRWEVPLIAPIEAFGRPLEEPSERGALAMAKVFAGPTIDFLDIGANRGVYSVAMARHYRRVLAVEPDPGLAEGLRANLARNQLPNVTVIEAAISDHAGRASFHRNLENPLMGSLESDFASDHRRAAIEVELTTIADLVEREGIERFVAKVDVEGHGMRAVRGIGSALDRCEALIVEITANEVRDGLARYLVHERGLHAYYIVDRVLKPEPDGEVHFEPPFLNWLFCRLEPAALMDRVHGFGLTLAQTA